MSEAIAMTSVTMGDWAFVVDVGATRRAYESIHKGAPEACGCLYCQNFAAARSVVYTTPVIAFYESLGVQYDREAETYEAGSAESKGQHYYGGWHHFIGRIVKRSLKDLQLGPSFPVNFSEAHLCAETPFQDAQWVVQVEFFIEVPWVLKQPVPQ